MASPLKRRNARVMAGLVGIVVAMVGLSFAAVPLYRLFCEATGYEGRRSAPPRRQRRLAEARLWVRFDAETAPDLGWEFRPLEKAVEFGPARSASWPTAPST